jgi:hypothetical protein
MFGLVEFCVVDDDDDDDDDLEVVLTKKREFKSSGKDHIFIFLYS